MSGIGDVMRELDSGVWAERNPNTCPCNGFGWLRSDYDTCHECPIHHLGVTPHPEDEEATFNFDMHILKVCRMAYAAFRNEALATKMISRVEFRKRATELVGENPTPRRWVDAADKIASELTAYMMELEAHKMGYSCRLEAAMDAEARYERACSQRGSNPSSTERDSWYR